MNERAINRSHNFSYPSGLKLSGRSSGHTKQPLILSKAGLRDESYRSDSTSARSRSEKNGMRFFGSDNFARKGGR